MVGSKENYKFDVGVKGLIMYLLGLIVSSLYMFKFCMLSFHHVSINYFACMVMLCQELCYYLLKQLPQG